MPHTQLHNNKVQCLVRKKWIKCENITMQTKIRHNAWAHTRCQTQTSTHTYKARHNTHCSKPGSHVTGSTPWLPCSFQRQRQPSTFIRRTISTVQLTWRLCSVVGKTWDFRRKSTISNHCQQPTMQSIFQGSTARKYQIILSTKYPRYLEKSTRISLHFNEFCWDEPVFKQYSATFDHYTIQFEISWHFLANLVVKSCMTVNECHWIIHSSCWPFNLKTELPTAHS